MDYVTRQFINLTKKFRKDLRKALSDLCRSLQQQTDAIRKANDRHDTQQEPEKPPLIVRAELHVPEDVEKDRKTNEDRQHRVQVWILIGTWGAFIAVSVYAYITLRQWREMIAARHQTQHAIDAANRSASASETANANAAKNFVEDRRPYIWNDALDFFVPAIHQPLRFRVHVANFGKSPAVRVKHSSVIFHGPTALKQADQWFDHFKNNLIIGGSETIMPPYVPQDPRTNGDGIDVWSQDSLDEAAVNYVLQNDFGEIIVARIEYYDLSGNFYWSHLCIQRYKSNALGNCKHNAMH